MAASLRRALAALAATLLAACSSGGGSSPPPGEIQVAVSPAEVTVLAGGVQPFTAAVTGTTDVRVTWSVREGSAGGTIAASGLYTAPAVAGVYHVVATSVADPARRGSATVTVEGSGRRTVQVVRRAAGGGLEGVPGVAVHRADAATGAHLATVVTGASGVADFGEADASRATFSIRRGLDDSAFVRSFVAVPPVPVTIRLDAWPGEARPATDPPSGFLVSTDPPATWDGWVLAPSGFVDPELDEGAFGIATLDVQDDGRVTFLAGAGGIESELRCGVWLDAALPEGFVPVTVPASSDPAGIGFSAPAQANVTLSAVRRGVVFTDREMGGWGASGTLGTCLGLLPGVDRWGAVARFGYASEYEQLGYDLVGRESWLRSARSLPGGDPPEAFAFEPVSFRIAELTYGGATVGATLEGEGTAGIDVAIGRVTWEEGGTRTWEVFAPGARAGGVAFPDVPGVTAPAWSSGVRVEASVLDVEGADGWDDAWEAMRQGGSAEALLRAAGAVAIAEARLTRMTPIYVVGFEGYSWERYGTIRSSDGQVECGTRCTGDYRAGTSAHLTATPNPGAEFRGWGGDCTSYGNQPAIDLPLVDRNVWCYPSFGPATGATYSLSVAIAGGWGALIQSDDGQIKCGDSTTGEHFSQCWSTFQSGYGLTLTARASMTSQVFDYRWLGDCTGTSPTTFVALDRNLSCSVELTPHAP